MLKSLVLLLCAGVLCFAYDFTDSIFNEALYENYKDLRDDHELSSSRSKRDVEESGENFCDKSLKDIKCCNYKNNWKVLQRALTYKKECYKEIVGDEFDTYVDPFTCDKLEHLKNIIVCIGECVGKKLQLVDSDGNLNQKIIPTKWTSHRSDPNWDWKKEASGPVLRKCFDLVSSNQNEINETYKCNPSALKLSHCVYLEFLKRCPVELQINSTRCDRLRHKVNSIDGFFQQELILKKIYNLNSKK